MHVDGSPRLEQHPQVTIVAAQRDLGFVVDQHVDRRPRRAAAPDSGTAVRIAAWTFPPRERSCVPLSVRVAEGMSAACGYASETRASACAIFERVRIAESSICAEAWLRQSSSAREQCHSFPARAEDGAADLAHAEQHRGQEQQERRATAAVSRRSGSERNQHRAALRCVAEPAHSTRSLPPAAYQSGTPEAGLDARLGVVVQIARS